MSLFSYVFRCLLLVITLFCSAMVAQAQQLDVTVETALDRYIQLAQTDETAAQQLLLSTMEQHADTASVRSKVRLFSYVVNDALYLQEQGKAALYGPFDQLLQQLLQLAEQTESADALAEITASELELWLYQNKLNDAIIKADTLAQHLAGATDPRVRYYGHNVLGRLYKADSQYEQALEHFIAALDAITDTDDAFTLRRRAFLNYNIALVHADLKNWSAAAQMTEQLIAEAIKYQHNNLLANLYILQGYIANSEKRIADAVQINQQGLAAALKNGDEFAALTFENNLGSGYIELGQYAAAKSILETALERAQRLKDTAGAELIKMNLGFIRVMAGEHDAGIEQMKAGMASFSKNLPKAEFEPYYEWLAKAYAAAGRYQQQAETLLEQMAIRDEIRKSDREEKLNQLQQRYDTKAKAQQITILEQENALNAQLLENQSLQQKLIWLVIIIVGFAAVMLFQLYRKVRRSNRKLYETNQQLAYQSQRDVLTGLYNRRALQEYLQKRALKRRNGDIATTVTGFLLLDIDFFKRINDNYGHAGGDVVLQELAHRLQDTCRDKDLVVRWGGEEVLLVLDNIDPAHVNAFVKRVLHAIGDKPVQYENQQIAVTASGGFVHLPFAGISEDQLDWEKVLQIADMALYLSKTNGRNQACLMQGLNVSFAEVEPQLYSDLASAIRAGHVNVATVAGPGGNVS